MRLTTYIKPNLADKLEAIFHPYDFIDLNDLLISMREVLELNDEDVQKKSDCIITSRERFNQLLTDNIS